MRFVDTSVLLDAISTDPDEAAKAAAARATVESADLALPVQDITVPIMLAAATTARALGCASVLTEDLADGRDYGGVHIENAFRTAA